MCRMQFRRIDNQEIERKSFSHSKNTMPLPDLIAVQKDSYDLFVKKGIRELFHEISPIQDWIGRDLELWFGEHYFDEPKFDEKTSKEKNITYEAPLRVKVKLTNKRTEQSSEQEIFLGDVPIMTTRGTFIINGVERVVVSQLIRSPGVYYTSEFYRGRKYYGSKVIP